MRDLSQFYGHPYANCGGRDWFEIVWMIIILVGLVAGVILTVRYFNSSRSNTLIDSQSPGPLDIVKERYAKGEITTEQYNEIRNELLKTIADKAPSAK